MIRSNNLIFNTIADLVEKLDNSVEIEDRLNSSDKPRNSEWDECEDYNEARQSLLHGKKYDDITLDVNAYKTQGTAEKRFNQMSVVGHTVVVPLYLQGIPTNMITSKQKINNKIITIIYECSAAFFISQNEILNTSKKLMRNIISLEKEGYRVNLYVMEQSEYNGKYFNWILKLKTDREILNLKKTMFPLVSPSMLRRIGFRIKERLFKDWVGSGYGRASHDFKEIDKFIQSKLKIKNYELWNYKGKVDRK